MFIIRQRRIGISAEQPDRKRSGSYSNSESGQGHLSEECTSHGGLEFWGSGFRINPSVRVHQTSVETLSDWEGKCDH